MSDAALIEPDSAYAPTMFADALEDACTLPEIDILTEGLPLTTLTAETLPVALTSIRTDEDIDDAAAIDPVKAKLACAVADALDAPLIDPLRP